MLKKFVKVVGGALVAGSMLLGGVAHAAVAGPDLTPLTATVDMGTTITAVLAIAAVLAGLLVAIRGAKTVLRMIGGR